MSGPESGRKIHLQSGQVAQFGRTEWADFSFPHDAQMSDVHFLVEVLPIGCRIRDLQSASGTLVDGEAVAETALSAGTRITAGRTAFHVELIGDTLRDTVSLRGSLRTEAGFLGTAAAVERVGPTAAEICRKYEVDDAAMSLLRPTQSADDFLQVLVDAGLLRDAMRFHAHRLPKREAVWWACLCVRHGGSQLSPNDQTAIDVAEAWVHDPTDDQARACEAAAESLRYETAAGWAAAAAFWSGTTIAPPGLEPVPPPDHLTGTAVAASLILAGIADAAAQASARYAEFLKLGTGISRGEHLWTQSPGKAG